MKYYLHALCFTSNDLVSRLPPHVQGRDSRRFVFDRELMYSTNLFF